MEQCPTVTGNHKKDTKAEQCPNRLTGLLYYTNCGAKLTHHKSPVQGKHIDGTFTCSRYRGVQDCTIHYIPTQKLETAKDCQKQIVRAKNVMPN